MRIIDDITNFIFLEDISPEAAMVEGVSGEGRLGEETHVPERDSVQEKHAVEEERSMKKEHSTKKECSMGEERSIDRIHFSEHAMEDNQAKADVIFIPGGSYPELPERAAELWRAGYAPYVVPSGRYSVTAGRFSGVKSKADIYGKDYATECEFYTDVLLSGGVDPGSILPEAQAQFTAENARLSRKVLDAEGIHPKKAILCCKGYHSRRSLMYYQINFPDTEFLIAPVYIDITRENWYCTERGRKKVLGELKRLGTQFTPELTPEWQDFQDEKCKRGI